MCMLVYPQSCAVSCPAEELCGSHPVLDMVRLCSSGTESTMHAIRLARGYTKREKIIKFSGCYHGHSDAFLIQAGSGAVTFGAPNSPGVTLATAKDTLLADYNDLDRWNVFSWGTNLSCHWHGLILN